MPQSSLGKLLTTINAHPLLDHSISYNDYVSLDLSTSNPKLQNINVSSSKDLEMFIWHHTKKNNAKVAYGGYLEVRDIYNRSSYFNNQDVDKRNIHLGLDLWIASGTPVFAPLDGKIHSFNNNENYGDYGPTIILEHNFEAVTFYTLYGHLNLESIAQLSIGAMIKKGDQIATLGTAAVNGDYPPHLHFQIIKDIQHYKGDYPGVCAEKDLEFYKYNCPNPNLLLKLY